MRVPICLVVIVGAILSPELLGADKRAKTEDGKDVILRDDGTWYYVDQAKKDKKASEVYKGKRGTFVISMTPGVWKKSEKRANSVTEVEFTHKDGDVMTMVIAERINTPLDALKRVVISNLKKQDKEAKVTMETKRTVNGSEVLFLTIDAKVRDIPFTYMYYLYSGRAGAIQVITFTGQNLVEDYRADMLAFMNGLEILKK
jgi:hypothetical protein